MLRWMRQLKSQGVLPGHIDLDAFEKKLQQDRIIREQAGRMKLTPKGEKQIRQDSLDRIFSSLKSDARGNHPMPYEGGGSTESLPERRPFIFGDSSQDIDFNESFSNAMRRSGLSDFALSESDLSVCETESTVSCATVLMLDMARPLKR